MKAMDPTRQQVGLKKYEKLWIRMNMVKKRKDQPKVDEAAMSFHVTTTNYLTIN